MGTNNIKFIAEDKWSYGVCPRPFPASQSIPEWWRDMTPYMSSPENPDGKKIIISNSQSNATFKKCTPMLDALTSGYIFPLWSDVQIKTSEDFPDINWRVQRNVFELHGASSQYMESPDGYYDRALKYVNMWHIKTPPGFSTLITTPFGYNNLPFKALTAIIDTDKSNHDITIPVWLKKGFDGIVEKGTPIFQAIPFKRNDWESSFDYYEDGERLMMMNRDVFSTIVNNYVKNVWHKKTYK